MPTWIDDEGRLREQADDRHQFLRPIPFECLDPWTSYDSWDAEHAIRLITIGYNLDIKAYWDEAKDFPHGSTGWDAARAYIDVYQRGMSIAKSSIAAGLLRNPDTPANWLAWAERKGYSVTHLKSQPAPPVPVADSASNSTTSDPERRLARLRALGGDAIYRRGEWRITGISALVASEKSEGRKRCDEKTIRADIKEAAENEREAKRSNAFAGLGQR